MPRGFLPSSRRRALPPSTHPTPSCVTSRPLVNRPLVGKSGRGCSCSERGRGSDRNWGQCVSNVHRPHDCQCHGHSRTRPGHCSADRPTELQAFITFPNFLTFLYWQVKVGGWHLLRFMRLRSSSPSQTDQLYQVIWYLPIVRACSSEYETVNTSSGMFCRGAVLRKRKRAIKMEH